ncbi:MAG: hypothetical protein FWC87_00220 [Acidimicrobiaceae bacterium]|nr:hypothetical protein [Acidimicrobiaceae bacterium]
MARKSAAKRCSECGATHWRPTSDCCARCDGVPASRRHPYLHPEPLLDHPVEDFAIPLNPLAEWDVRNAHYSRHLVDVFLEADQHYPPNPARTRELRACQRLLKRNRQRLLDSLDPESISLLRAAVRQLPLQHWN